MNTPKQTKNLVLSHSDETTQPCQPAQTGDTDVILSGGNYYACVRGNVYMLRAFGLKSEADEYTQHLRLGINNKTQFLREYGWMPIKEFRNISTIRAALKCQEFQHHYLKGE